MIVVADTTPLLVLAGAGHLDVLRDLFEEVVLPEVVWRELTSDPGRDGVASLLGATWLRVDRREAQPVDARLDPGEAAAIALAIALGADLLLIDERAGRAVARRLGLSVRGTVGVLVEAERRGLIGSADEVLSALVTAGFYVSPTVLAAARR